MSDNPLTIPSPGGNARPESIKHAPFERQARAVGRALAGVWRRYPADVVALASLFLISVVGLWLFWVYDNWLGEFDILTMFIPWFGYIGDRLAAGELPAWSPHYFGGAPVIGNPSGGWMYLQVMVLYTLFPILTATKLLLLTHMLIAGSAVYAFSRRIGLVPVAALMSSGIFVIGQILYGGTSFLTIATQANTWMVVGLLAAEMAMWTRRASAILGWAALLGVAIVQMFVAWPGQGVAYGCLWIGGWILYRLLVMPVPGVDRFGDRLAQVVLFGSSAAVATLAFGAGGIMPMLDFLAESTVPNGDYSNVVGGEYAGGTHGPAALLSMFFQGNVNFEFTVPSKAFGAEVMILAIIGVWRARWHYGALFFAVMFGAAFTLMITHSPTLWLFSQLPVIGGIHAHRPSGVSWMMAIGTAMLAGIAVQKLIDNDRPPLRLPHLVVLVSGLAICLATVNSRFVWIGWWGWGAAFAAIFLYALPGTDIVTPARHLKSRYAPRIAGAIAVVALVLAYGFLWTGFWLVIALAAAAVIYLLSLDDPTQPLRRLQPHLTRVVAYVLVVLVFVSPLGWDIYTTIKYPETIASGWTDSPGKEEESEWAIETSMLRKDPGTAAEFLQQQQLLLGPFRYAGFALAGEFGPWTGEENEGHKSGYSWRRFEPGVVGILVNARTYRLGLYQTGGYNPIQIRYWTEYVDVMNGKRQDYHWLDPYTPALDGSQLLDMLNVRYILVDKSIPDYRTPKRLISEAHTEVYRDDLVIVYENEQVFPHAWIVHDVQDNGNGYGLRLLAGDQVNGREVAFVNTDGELPAVAPKLTGDVAESANVVSYEPEHIVLTATAASDGFLVMSDPYATGWNAYVDGEKVDVYRTNHALRGISLPAGTHTVEFKYEPQSIRVGMLITGVGAIAILGIWAWALYDWRRNRQAGTALDPVVVAAAQRPSGPLFPWGMGRWPGRMRRQR